MVEEKEEINAERTGVRMSALEGIIKDLNKNPALKEIFGIPVSEALMVVADNNDLRIEDAGMIDLSEQQIKKFLQILDKVVARHLDDTSKKDDNKPRDEKSLFANAVKKQLNRALDDKQSRLEKLMSEEKELFKDIGNLSKEAYELSVEIEAFESDLESIEEKAKREYKAIKNLENVEKIGVKDGFLTIITKPITIEGVKIGKFEITLKNGGIDLKNLDFPRSAYLHPHIKKSDELIICWGNIKGYVEQLINRFEYVSAIQLIINFLQSYQKSDCFKSLDYFNQRTKPYFKRKSFLSLEDIQDL